MNYFIVKDGAYVVGIGITENNVRNPISRDDADKIRNTLIGKPNPPEGFDYRLKTDLTWELYELPPEDPDPYLTAEEALDTILGGGGNETI